MYAALFFYMSLCIPQYRKRFRMIIAKKNGQLVSYLLRSSFIETKIIPQFIDTQKQTK